MHPKVLRTSRIAPNAVTNQRAHADALINENNKLVNEGLVLFRFHTIEI